MALLWLVSSPSWGPLQGPPYGAPPLWGCRGVRRAPGRLQAPAGFGSAGFTFGFPLASWAFGLSWLGFRLDFGFGLIFVCFWFGFTWIWIDFDWIRLDFDLSLVGFDWIWLDLGWISVHSRSNGSHSSLGFPRTSYDFLCIPRTS